jgi:hypothetical protein
VLIQSSWLKTKNAHRTVIEVKNVSESKSNGDNTEMVGFVKKMLILIAGL